MIVLEFMFQSFWHFLGCALLILWTYQTIVAIIKALRR